MTKYVLFCQEYNHKCTTLDNQSMFIFKSKSNILQFFLFVARYLYFQDIVLPFISILEIGDTEPSLIQNVNTAGGSALVVNSLRYINLTTVFHVLSDLRHYYSNIFQHKKSVSQSWTVWQHCFQPSQTKRRDHPEVKIRIHGSNHRGEQKVGVKQ